MLVYDSGLLNPPSLLKAAVLADTVVKIDWTDNSTNEDGFKIERKLTELGEWKVVGTVGSSGFYQGAIYSKGDGRKD